MALDRHTPTFETHPTGIDDTDAFAEIDEEVYGLWQRSPCNLSNIGGTANAITAECTPTLLEYALGNRFTFIPATDNGGASTIDIDGLGVKSLCDLLANALVGGELLENRLEEIIYDGTCFRHVPRVEAGSSSGVPGLIVRDLKAAATAGGTFTSGAARTRDLNDVVRNVISGASLGSNQITLPTGTYYAESLATSWAVGRNQAWLYNVTASAILVPGTSEYSDIETGEATTHSVVCGVFTLGASSTIELRHQCESSKTGNGFGVEANFGNQNVYSLVKIWQIS